MRCRTLKLTILPALVSVPLYAEAELDELLGGFDTPETAVEIAPAAPAAEPPSAFPLQATGALAFSTSYNYAHKAPESGATDYRGFSRARTKLDLSFDMKFSSDWRAKLELKGFEDAIYTLKKRDNYTADTLETYEKETEIKEAYIQGSLLANLDIKAGRQIVVWGKSDNIRITDVINPMDNREQGMVDIEDLRLPVTMTKLDYYYDSWNLSAMAIHEARIQKEAGTGSDFLPTHIFPLPPGATFPEDEAPDSNFENTQYALALNGRFSGWDLSLYRANVLNSRWHFEENRSIRRYDQVHMSGVAVNFAFGNLLLKSEGAYFDNLRYNTTSDRKRRLDVMVGAEYQGISDTTLSLEIAQRHLYDYESAMAQGPDFTRQDEMQSALRATRSFSHEQGHISYLLSLFSSKGAQDGGFHRLWADYDIQDDLEVSTGIVDYIGGAKPFFEAIADNDRIFADLTYSF